MVTVMVLRMEEEGSTVMGLKEKYVTRKKGRDKRGKAVILMKDGDLV